MLAVGCESNINSIFPEMDCLKRNSFRHGSWKRNSSFTVFSLCIKSIEEVPGGRFGCRFVNIDGWVVVKVKEMFPD